MGRHWEGALITGRLFLVVFLFVLSSIAIGGAVNAPSAGLPAPARLHEDSAPPSSFVAQGQGYPTITIPVYAGFTVFVQTQGSFTAPTDSLGTGYSIIVYAAFTDLWVGQATATGTDTITVAANSLVVEVQSEVVAQYGGGTNPVYPTVLHYDSTIVFGDFSESGTCSTSGGTAWSVECVSDELSGFAQNVSAGTSPEVSTNGSYSGSLWWVQVPADLSESPANVDAAGIFSPTNPSAGEQPANGTIIAPAGSNVTVLIRNWCGENDFGTLTFDPTTTEHFEAFVGDFNPYYYSLYNFTMPADSVFLAASGGGCGQAIAWFALSVFIWPFLSAVGNGASGSYTIGTSCPDGYACVALGWVNPSDLPSATGWAQLASSRNYASSESSSYATTAAPYSLTPTGGDGVVVLIGDAPPGTPRAVQGFSAIVGMTWIQWNWSIEAVVRTNVTLFVGTACGAWSSHSLGPNATAFNSTGLDQGSSYCATVVTWNGSSQSTGNPQLQISTDIGSDVQTVTSSPPPFPWEDILVVGVVVAFFILVIAAARRR